jgi:hypothetical protein
MFSYDQLAYDYFSNPSAYYDGYKFFKHKDTIYSLNDNMLIRNELEFSIDFSYTAYVCKLIKIVKPKVIELEKVPAVLLV